MVGLVSKIYNKIALLNPRIEVKLRQLYWHNSSQLGKYNPNRTAPMDASENETQKVDFERIIKQLKEWGVKEGSLLIVHSSYDNLKSTGLSPIEIISKLRMLIGESGTLAMPVIRRYKEEPDPSRKTLESYRPPKSTYSPTRTPVSSGLLPNFLMRTPGAEISMHPLNPLCAVGPLAKQMMMGNIDGYAPSPHGAHSAWHFCMQHDAIVISLGTDLRHHNTMGHVAEEAFDDWHWSDEDWYNLRDFTIQKSKEESFDITVKERKPLWGMLHLAEMNRYHDFLKDGIVQSRMFGNILVEKENAKQLISYLRLKNKNGYPYF